MAKLVILLPLFLIGKHVVGLVDLLELLLCLFIAGVHIGVIFFGKRAIGLFNVTIACGLFYPQHLIIILFFCHSISLTG